MEHFWDFQSVITIILTKKIMKKQTTTSPLQWNTMLGLCSRLRDDQHLYEYLLVLMGCHFGLRCSDLIRITWAEVLGKDEIFLLESKTLKNRSIKIHKRVQEAVQFCKPILVNDEQLSNPILANRWGKVVSISYINKRIKWIFSRYQIKTDNGSSHTLRKTFSLRLYQLNGETESALVFLSEVLGHSSIAMSRKYLGISKKLIGDAYMNL